MAFYKGEDDFMISWGKESEFVLKKENSLNSVQDYFDGEKGNYLFGYLNYDLKNRFESNLKSKNEDKLHFPLLYFFVPQHIIFCKRGELIYFGDSSIPDLTEIITKEADNDKHSNFTLNLNPYTTKTDYIQAVEQLQNQIQQGFIYEVNYCVNFEGNTDGQIIEGEHLFERLSSKTEAPFSAFFSHPNQELICASPERFIRRKKDRLISQPIKGTSSRGTNEQIDDELKQALFNDPKERSENVMITDLVRNDLSKIAQKRSVSVEHLCEVKSFKTVHQLVSTVGCDLKPEVNILEIIKALFPMGSMTGAPKISAMEHSEQYESFKRGIYSGSVGYIDPNGNMDFNVVIRSIFRNKKTNHLSAAVGGAITIDSVPEKEYQECLLKLEALKASLENH
ncbi:MAG: anthranilate synthase component I family protein [Flavobacteriales bacterium]|nr:anthranilate synthase component I family protein [Flavobacteriales bacterium]